jgi:hypothetical protein
MEWLLIQESGPVMTRSLKHAWPTCYGAESYNFQPHLPPRHPLVAQEHIFVDEYLEYLWSKHHPTS